MAFSSGVIRRTGIQVSFEFKTFSTKDGLSDIEVFDLLRNMPEIVPRNFLLSMHRFPYLRSYIRLWLKIQNINNKYNP